MPWDKNLDECEWNVPYMLVSEIYDFSYTHCYTMCLVVQKWEITWFYHSLNSFTQGLTQNNHTGFPFMKYRELWIIRNLSSWPQNRQLDRKTFVLHNFAFSYLHYISSHQFIYLSIYLSIQTTKFHNHFQWNLTALVKAFMLFDNCSKLVQLT